VRIDSLDPLLVNHHYLAISIENDTIVLVIASTIGD